MADRHDWISWDQYQNIHNSRLQDFDHFILDNQLTAVPTDILVFWNGSLYCMNGIEIVVEKTQDVRSRDGVPEVRTRTYKYQVLQKDGERAVKLLRYDNSTHHQDHPDAHHRHRFDENGEQIYPVEHVGADKWPTLGDVIQEVYDRWFIDTDKT